MPALASASSMSCLTLHAPQVRLVAARAATLSTCCLHCHPIHLLPAWPSHPFAARTATTSTLQVAQQPLALWPAHSLSTLLGAYASASRPCQVLAAALERQLQLASDPQPPPLSQQQQQQQQQELAMGAARGAARPARSATQGAAEDAAAARGLPTRSVHASLSTLADQDLSVMVWALGTQMRALADMQQLQQRRRRRRRQQGGEASCEAATPAGGRLLLALLQLALLRKDQHRLPLRVAAACLWAATQARVVCCAGSLRA